MKKINPNHYNLYKQELLSSEGYVRAFSSLWNKQIIAGFKMMKAADRNEIVIPYYWIRYEDLHQDAERYRNEIYKFLGINSKQAAPLGKGTVAGFNKIDNTTFYRRGEVGIWKEYFTEKQLSWFMEEASEGLALIQQKIS